MAIFGFYELGFQRNDQYLFRNTTIELDAGEVLQIEGRNGSGKTTLLRILCGLTLPSEGRIVWQGRDVQEVLPEYREALAYVGHLPGLKDELTARENLEFGAGLGSRNSNVSISEALERTGLPFEREDVPCRTLSAGQRRRVALARLLVSRARLWVLDEPFTALDPQGRQMVEDLLSQHAAAGGSAVLTTHHAVQLGGCGVTTLDLSA